MDIWLVCNHTFSFNTDVYIINMKGRLIVDTYSNKQCNNINIQENCEKLLVFVDIISSTY